VNLIFYVNNGHFVRNIQDFFCILNVEKIGWGNKINNRGVFIIALLDVNYKKLTEEHLIKACIKGDAASQKEVFDRFAGRMLGVCHRYARNAADAEDILQDAFIKIFDKLHQFKFEGSFEGWIRRIVVNTALKKYSVRRYEKEVSGYEHKDKDESFLEPSAYSHLTQKDILDLINNLPDGYRLVFNLFVIEGFQHDEIAEMLGIQPGTSRSQLVKARMMLQKQIIQLHKIAV
jgi:RNA polymerase sigma factor (sigma-70 family)